MTYLIKPFESIGDFVFGTSLEEVQKNMENQQEWLKIIL